MDLRTFLRTTESLLTELEGDLKPGWVRSIRTSLEHGEEGFGLNELLYVLVKHEIPVTPAHRDTLYELINYFPPLNDEWLRHLPYLMTASIDWLTVVDE